MSLKATRALGLKRTYFGVELGLEQPKWITEFPYGYIPHPMIVSQCVALLGFFKLAAFRSACWWLVPVHLACYMVHMMQEHFDLHRSRLGWQSLSPSIFSMGGLTEKVLRGGLKPKSL